MASCAVTTPPGTVSFPFRALVSRDIPLAKRGAAGPSTTFESWWYFSVIDPCYCCFIPSLSSPSVFEAYLGFKDKRSIYLENGLDSPGRLNLGDLESRVVLSVGLESDLRRRRALFQPVFRRARYAVGGRQNGVYANLTCVCYLLASSVLHNEPTKNQHTTPPTPPFLHRHGI